MGLFGPKTPKIKVTIMIRGRIGDGWFDVDEALKVPVGVTLGEFIDVCESKGIRFREALENSPHLRHTLMLNGDRCPIEEQRDRVLADGDELYLLAPIAGG